MKYIVWIVSTSWSEFFVVNKRDKRRTRATLYLLPVRLSWVVRPWSLAFPAEISLRCIILFPKRGVDTDISYKHNRIIRLCVKLLNEIHYSPRSKNENRYISERIGISRKSILRHNFFSCSGVKFGGGGRDESPPKSIFSDWESWCTCSTLEMLERPPFSFSESGDSWDMSRRSKVKFGEGEFHIGTRLNDRSDRGQVEIDGIMTLTV